MVCVPDDTSGAILTRVYPERLKICAERRIRGDVDDFLHSDSGGARVGTILGTLPEI